MLTAALDAGAVSDSSYVKNNSVNELMDNVQTITTAASEVVGTRASDAEHLVDLLKGALGEPYLAKAADAGVIKRKEGGGYELIEGTYTTDGGFKVKPDLQNQLSNLMVFSVAEDLKSKTAPGEMAQLMMSGYIPSSELDIDLDNYETATILSAQYAFYKAYAEDCGKEASFNELNKSIIAAGKSGSATDNVKNALAGFVTENMTGIGEYITANGGENLVTNAEAIPQIMTGVSAVEGNYKSSPSDGNLYTSGGVAADLTNYINVAGMAANLTPEQKAALGSAEGGMIITVGPNGVSNPSLS